jgi:4-hydroxybenzoyl-CoA reductase beta subunit
MIFNDFDYQRPASLEEARTLLGNSDGEGRLLAGGTDLLPNMRAAIANPGLLISLGGIEARAPLEDDGGALNLDALSRLADLERSDLLREKFPMLAEAAHSVAGNQVREMGTLGGNLCQENRCLYYNQLHDYQFVEPCYKRDGECCYPFPGNDRDVCWSVYMSDVAPVLIAMRAEIEILGEGGKRRIAAQDLFTGDGMKPLTLAPSELVSSVIVPPPPPRSGWGYHKTTVRGGLDFGTAIMALTLRLEEDGETCAGARIVLGAVGEGPLRPSATEDGLKGSVLSDENLARAADEASREVNPLPHHGFNKGYLRDNIRVHLRRALGRAVQRAGQA